MVRLYYYPIAWPGSMLIHWQSSAVRLRGACAQTFAYPRSRDAGARHQAPFQYPVAREQLWYELVSRALEIPIIPSSYLSWIMDRYLHGVRGNNEPQPARTRPGIQTLAIHCLTLLGAPSIESSLKACRVRSSSQGRSAAHLPSHRLRNRASVLTLDEHSAPFPSRNGRYPIPGNIFLD